MEQEQNADSSAKFQPQLTSEEQEIALEEAKLAAIDGNPVRMLESLHKSRALDGLVRRLHRTWPDLAQAEIQLIVAKAVDAAYTAVRNGTKVFHLMPFLWKVGYRRAYDCARARAREILVDPIELQRLADAGTTGAVVATDDLDEKRDRQIQRAVQIARRLLPRLGQENVQRVMALVIDAAEQRLADLPNAHIADVLGLSIDTVKQGKTRGFRRLARIARDEGLIDEATLKEFEGTVGEPTEKEEED